jgi:hypothetical protein
MLQLTICREVAGTFSLLISFVQLIMPGGSLALAVSERAGGQSRERGFSQLMAAMCVAQAFTGCFGIRPAWQGSRLTCFAERVLTNTRHIGSDHVLHAFATYAPLRLYVFPQDDASYAPWQYMPMDDAPSRAQPAGPTSR